MGTFCRKHGEARVKRLNEQDDLKKLTEHR